jgi:hypothetical protein
MTRHLFALPLLAVALAASQLPGADEAKGKEIFFSVHNGYFESNKSGLKGDASYLAITDGKVFDGLFGKAVTMGKKPNFLPANTFESDMVAATIKRGNMIFEYKVEKVTADEGTVYVQYKATGKDGGTATFASPLIVKLPREKYTEVVFIENGKKVGTAKIEK